MPISIGDKRPVAAARRLAEADYRSIAADVMTRTLAVTATAYDWLLRHVLGPFFTLRLPFLDADERRRIAEHWALLHKARDPLANRTSEPASVDA